MSINRNSIVKTVAIAILVVFTSTISGFAAGNSNREKALEELKQFKHDFMKMELKLSRDQEASFFKYYDQMFDEIVYLGRQTRKLERKVLNDPKATDLEKESAARTVFELKKKEGDIELRYFDQFKTILTPNQLLMLKPAERKMIKAIIKYQQEQKAKNKKQ